MPWSKYPPAGLKRLRQGSLDEEYLRKRISADSYYHELSRRAAASVDHLVKEAALKQLR